MANDTVVRSAGGGESFVERAKRVLRFEGPRRYLKDVRTEMRKVTTPSLKQVQATTMVVVVTVFLFALYFYGVDKVIGFFVDMIFKKAGS